MAVQARFFIDRIVKHARFEGIEVFMSPVTGGRASGVDNTDWAKFTPSGEIKLTVTNESAKAWFEAHMGGDHDIAITFDARNKDE